MGYKGSYIWKLRQKVGRDRLLTVTVDVLPVNQAGQVKLVYVKEFDRWNTIGGHAEEGDSFRSAALAELAEEAGLQARADDLTLFATLSGPGRIYDYPDGQTQAFTLVFCLDKWQSEGDFTDDTEITSSQWFSLEEALALPSNDSTRQILLAYKAFRRTGTVQMIEQ